MGLLNRFIWIFVSPTRVFDDVRDGRSPWWEPWIWQSIIYAIAGYISLPIQRAVTELNADNLSPEQLEQQLSAIDRFGWLQVVATPPLILLLGLFLAGVTYVLVTILSSRANFRQYFTITLYASLIGGVAMLVSNIAVRLRGLDAIRSVQDAQVTIGLGFLAPEGSTAAYAVLSTINVFSIWSFVVLGLGLMRVFDMSRNQAIACVVPWWVISVIFSVLGAALGGLG
jgi:hypothetical protein